MSRDGMKVTSSLLALNPVCLLIGPRGDSWTKFWGQLRWLSLKLLQVSRLTKLYKHLIPSQLLTCIMAHHCHSLNSMKSQLALMTFRVTGKQFISFKKIVKETFISQDLCLKCPGASFLSDLILCHFQLPFFLSFSMSSCQDAFDLRDMPLFRGWLWQGSHLPPWDNSTGTHSFFQV